MNNKDLDTEISSSTQNELLVKEISQWNRWTRERWVQVALLGATALAVFTTLLGKDDTVAYRNLPGKPTATPANVGGSIENPYVTATPLIIRTPPSLTKTPELTPNRNFAFEAITNQGIEVYGSKNPIANNEIPQFVDFLNNRDKDIKLDPTTYYGTIFAYRDVYTEFPKDNGESLEAFLLRHEKTLTEIIKYAGGSKIRLNKLVVLDTAIGESVAGVDQIEKSDGFWILNQIYRPAASAYFDPKTKIDWGFEHELGHAVLDQPDEYPLDTTFKNLAQTPETLQALEGIPEKWQDYWASRRHDIADDLMSNTFSPQFQGYEYKTENYFINEYSYNLILWHLKNNDIHNKEKMKEAAWAYRNDIPEKIHLWLGKDLAGSKFEIYRTFENQDHKKEWGKILDSTVSEDYIGSVTLEKNQLFPPKEEKLVKAEIATFLVKVTDNTGKIYFRYLDIRDFNLAYWQGYQDEVTMRFKLATINNSPETYDYRITYIPQ